MRSVRAELFASTGWFGSVHASEFEAELTRRASLRLSESRGEARNKPGRRVVEGLAVKTAAAAAAAAAAMPSSVGMRRTTRVFGVVKGADGARVLRSGRRLWPDSAEAKTTRRQSEGDEWIKMVKTGGGGGTKGGAFGAFEANGWVQKASNKPAVVEIKPKKLPPHGELAKDRFQNEKLFGIVYNRKRKLLAADRRSVEAGERRFGHRFVRRQRRKLNSGEGFEPREVVSVVAGSILARNYLVARFMCLVLVYMTRAQLRLADLFAFLASEPLNGVHSSSGINLFLDHPLARRVASCKIFGAVQSVPLFSVDFSTVPLCFMNIHSSMNFRYNTQLLLLNKPTDSSYESDDEELDCGAIVSSNANNAESKWVSSPYLRASKLLGRSTHYRNGLMSRGIQKRRSSLRRKSPRIPSLSGIHKHTNGLVSDLVSFRRNAVSISVTSHNKIRKSVRINPAKNLKDVSSKGRDSTTCGVNMLVIEPDKCYRIEGAHVALDMSPLGEWVIAVKKDGVTKLTHKAEKVMKPYISNRFTHAITWTVDNCWKLEFHDRKDWIAFKDLYKECLDRNMPTPGVKVIPIPGVNEVSPNGDNDSKLFCRPDSYISVKDDEVCRTMARKTAYYDLDSEDESWLKKFNTESSVENDSHVRLLEDTLELMVDAFEKAYYCSPYDLSEDKPPADLCSNLGSRKVVEAVYGYWMEKRNLKRSSLLRVFQSHQLKRASLVPKPLFRKKRSFNRQPSKVGRIKRVFMPAMMPTAEDTAEEQNSRCKVEAAKASAKKCVELAVRKRRKAQQLMHNADLATLKATLALRIAEGAAISESTAIVADHFLD